MKRRGEREGEGKRERDSAVQATEQSVERESDGEKESDGERDIERERWGGVGCRCLAGSVVSADGEMASGKSRRLTHLSELRQQYVWGSNDWVIQW